MLLGICLTSSAFLYACSSLYIDPLKNFYEQRVKKYVVSVKEKIEPYCLQTTIFCCLLYKLLLQRVRGTLKSIGRNKHELSYYVGLRRYKLQLNTRSLPCPVIQVTDENEDMVTDDVLEYMGPRYDFHNITYSPGDLGYKSLIFYTSDGGTFTFNEKDVIKLF
jgi:hypothetical protein